MPAESLTSESVISEILFYHGAAWYDRVIEAFEHSPWSHVAARVGETVYEAISTGVRRRPYDPQGLDRDAASVPHALDEAILVAALGRPYDWAALGEDALCPLLPPGLGLTDTRTDEDCSRLVAAAGRLDLTGLPGPPTPADVYRLSLENNHGTS